MKNEIKEIVFLDVRNMWEYKENHLRNTILIPFNKLQIYIEKMLPNKDISIIIFCSTGTRSKVAKKYLNEKGYKNIIKTCTMKEAEEIQKTL